MPPIRPDDHAYRFRPAMLRELRERLNLTQAQMAQLLEIPVNTLSRWETGANLPDANALAAIHSIAADRGVTPQFFEERGNAMIKLKNLKNRIIDWDFQNLGLQAEDIARTCNELNRYINTLCGRPNNSERYVYATVLTSDGNLSQRTELQKAGFEIVQCAFNADSQIIADGKDLFSPTSDLKPKESVYVLISNDGDYAQYLKSFRDLGVETFVYGSGKCSDKLIKAVGRDHFIPLERPYLIFKCLEVVRELKGEHISKANFGDLCRRKLADDEFDMENTGFSLNRPYASALQHMVSMGIVKISQIDNDPNRITITEIKR